MPSQWALQYFDPSVVMQLQAEFAHFLGLAIIAPPSPALHPSLPPFSVDRVRNQSAASSHFSPVVSTRPLVYLKV
jgi:hypothetical protein